MFFRGGSYILAYLFRPCQLGCDWQNKNSKRQSYYTVRWIKGAELFSAEDKYISLCVSARARARTLRVKEFYRAVVGVEQERSLNANAFSIGARSEKPAPRMPRRDITLAGYRNARNPVRKRVTRANLAPRIFLSESTRIIRAHSEMNFSVFFSSPATSDRRRFVSREFSTAPFNFERTLPSPELHDSRISIARC